MTKVLIVDDEPGTLNALRIGLMSYGFQVAAAGNGIYAIDLITKNLARNEPFHIMVTDFRMPGMDGMQLICAARLLLPGLPVLLITGYGSEGLMRDARRAGVSGYLDKPFTPDTLAQKVMEVLEISGDKKAGIN